MPHTFEELTRFGEGELAALWRRGTAPAGEALAGHIFRGRNTAFGARLGPGGGAFAKGFVQGEHGLDGCNFPVKVREPEWRVDAARPFGFFRIEPARGAPRGEGPQSALLLDYGRGRAEGFRRAGAPGPGLPLRLIELAARPLRDVLVQPPDAADGVLIGRAFYSGTLAVPVTFFVLERYQPLAAHWATAAARRHRRVS